MERDQSRALRLIVPLSTSLTQFAILLFVLMALTGFVCTHKIQAEEDCLSTNILCYECDSRYDPNCADPFDFSPNATLESPAATITTTRPLHKQQANETGADEADHENHNLLMDAQSHARSTNDNNNINNDTNLTIPAPPSRKPKKLPPVAICYGCCVKISSRLPDGVLYVKRTCTTNIQINYFMVGLVCMKESGDKGRMCFCENDYCNGQTSIHSHPFEAKLLLTLLTIVFSIARIFSAFSLSQPILKIS